MTSKRHSNEMHHYLRYFLTFKHVAEAVVSFAVAYPSISPSALRRDAPIEVCLVLATLLREISTTFVASPRPHCTSEVRRKAVRINPTCRGIRRNGSRFEVIQRCGPCHLPSAPPAAVVDPAPSFTPSCTVEPLSVNALRYRRAMSYAVVPMPLATPASDLRDRKSVV